MSLIPLTQLPSLEAGIASYDNQLGFATCDTLPIIRGMLSTSGDTAIMETRLFYHTAGQKHHARKNGSGNIWAQNVGAAPVLRQGETRLNG